MDVLAALTYYAIGRVFAHQSCWFACNPLTASLMILLLSNPCPMTLLVCLWFEHLLSSFLGKAKLNASVFLQDVVGPLIVAPSRSLSIRWFHKTNFCQQLCFAVQLEVIRVELLGVHSPDPDYCLASLLQPLSLYFCKNYSPVQTLNYHTIRPDFRN